MSSSGWDISYLLIQDSVTCEIGFCFIGWSSSMQASICINLDLIYNLPRWIIAALCEIQEVVYQHKKYKHRMLKMLCRLLFYKIFDLSKFCLFLSEHKSISSQLWTYDKQIRPSFEQLSAVIALTSIRKRHFRNSIVKRSIRMPTGQIKSKHVGNGNKPEIRNA